MKQNLIDSLHHWVSQNAFPEPSESRISVLQSLIEYVQERKDIQHSIHLNFICTHNSRRSQFAQIWAQIAAHYHGIDVHTYSGGIEETEFNERAIAALKKCGIKIEKEGESNPVYSLIYAPEVLPIKMFSKLFDHDENPKEEFAAIMTCSHADEHCPHITGADQRIALDYSDPKEYDNTQLESEKYDERSLQIASEMWYVFSQVK